MLVPNLVNRPDSRVIIVQRLSVMFCDGLWYTPDITERKLSKILLPVKIVKPPPPSNLPHQPVCIMASLIQRYRDLGCGNLNFHYLYIRCKKVETIVLTMCAGRLVITRTGLDTKQRIRSEVENISPRRKIISTPNIRPVNICRRNCVTVWLLEHFNVIYWYQRRAQTCLSTLVPPWGQMTIWCWSC